MTDEILAERFPPMRIRDALPADAEAIADFNSRLSWETEAKRFDPQVIGRGVRLALERPALCRYFLAEVDGGAVGQTMITYEWSDWRAGPDWLTAVGEVAIRTK